MVGSATGSSGFPLATSMAKRARLSGVSPLARASARSKVEDVQKILKDADSDGDSLLSLERAGAAARIRYALLDVDGVCVMGQRAIPRSAAALARLRGLVRGHRLITNQSQESCSSVMRKLQRLHFDVRPGEVFSALSAAKSHVAMRKLRPLCLLTKAAMEEFEDVAMENPNAVVVGTAPTEMHYKRLTEAMRVLMEEEDSELIAVNKGRYFKENGEFQLMAGPFVAALEYATGKSARVVGKPSPDFFTAVAHDAAGPLFAPEQVVMVGDDVRDDIQGAMDVGMRAILVKTGKYRPGDEEICKPAPLAVVDCLADAVSFLEESGLVTE
eukprot:s2413_g3.t1